MINDVLQKVKAPAIALLLIAILNGTVGFLVVISGLLRLTGIVPEDSMPVNEAERAGYIFGTFLGYGIGVLSLICAPIVLLGAIKMMKGNSYGLSMAGAVLAILPATSCCFLLGIPIGIWAILVLRKPDVKAYFQGGLPMANNFPPSPPNQW